MSAHKQRKPSQESTALTRGLAVTSLLISLIGLGWSIWTWYRVDVVTRAEKRTAVIEAVATAHSEVKAARTQMEQSVQLVKRSRPYMQCADRKAADMFIQRVSADAAELAKGEKAIEQEEAQLTHDVTPDESAARLEWWRAITLLFDARLAEEHSSNPSDIEVEREFSEHLSTTPVTCPGDAANSAASKINTTRP